MRKAWAKGAKPSPSEPLRLWLKDALYVSRLQQAELARRMTLALQRPIHPLMVSRMISGSRVVHADELLAASLICGTPLSGVHLDDGKLKVPRLLVAVQPDVA